MKMALFGNPSVKTVDESAMKQKKEIVCGWIGKTGTLFLDIHHRRFTKELALTLDEC